MRAIIIDIDGTLSDPSHRLHHLDGEVKDWTSFHDGMTDDPAMDAVVWLARLLDEGSREFSNDYYILIVTARHEDYREHTIEWLRKHNISYNDLYMRMNNDFRPDHLVKADILNQILDDGYEPFLAIDDQPTVIDMWRSFGITALACMPPYKPSKYAGQELLHVLVGPAGAGKSTYTIRHYQPKDVVSTDAVRVELFGDHRKGHNPDELAATWKYVHGLIKLRLENGRFTVLDATNLKQKDRLKVLDQVPDGILVRYVVISRNYDDMIRDRGWRSEELISKHYRVFKSELNNIMNADGRGNVVVVDKRIT